MVLRQEHRAGEKTFVDHAGDTIPVIEPATGQTRPAYVFVAVLGASNYTYAEATWTRGLPDWIGSHKRHFFSLAQVNDAIAELLGKLNQRPFHKLPDTRLELYRKLDRPALQPLPHDNIRGAAYYGGGVVADDTMEVAG